MHEKQDSPADKQNIAYFLDVYGKSTLKKVVGSEDGKAFYLITLLRGQLGSSQNIKAYHWLQSILNAPDLHKPP